MCLICGDLENQGAPHLVAEIHALTDDELKSIIDRLKSQYNSFKFLQETPPSPLRKTLMALLTFKSRRDEGIHGKLEPEYSNLSKQLSYK